MNQISPKTATPEYGASRGTYLTYAVGYILSICLTLAAYLLVHRHVSSHHLAFSHQFLVVSIIALAIVQLFVQLIFFLHLDGESKPRWNLQVFGFMLLVLLIIVVGSLWIMSNLNYHMKSSPQQVNQYLQSQDGL